MLEDLGATLKIRRSHISYNKDKDPLENIKDYLHTLKYHIIKKDQDKEIETTLNNEKKTKEKTLRLKLETDKLEIEESKRKFEKAKYELENAQLQSELMASQANYTRKLRDENIELMDKYEGAMKENYELKLKMKNVLLNVNINEDIQKTLYYKQLQDISTINPNHGKLIDSKLKLEEMLLKEKENNCRIASSLNSLAERNELLKEELQLQRERNRYLEKELYKSLKKNTNLSQEVTINKHNYKSMAANHAQAANKLKKLQRENKNLKEKVNATFSAS